MGKKKINKSNDICIRTKKCIVRIKRIKLPQINSTVDDATISPTTTHTVHNCKVRLKRISPVDKLSSKINSRSQDRGSIATTTNANEICTLSFFEPPRNSTMCVPPDKMSPCRVRIKRLNNKANPIDAPSTSNLQSTQIVPAEPVRNEGKRRFFHREAPLRTRSSVTRNVYEFLSQSQIADVSTKGANDPSADVIQKLVEEGKACVVQRSKKTGKFRVKTIKRKIRPVGKRKICSITKESNQEEVAAADNAPAVRPNDQLESNDAPSRKRRPMSPIFEQQNDFDLDIVETAPEPETSLKLPSPHHKAVADGTFSELARAVLVNNQSMQDRSKRRRLLDVARKFISTPLNHKKTNTQLAANSTVLSPIMKSTNKSPHVEGKLSPWRIPDESPLPGTFIFGLNSSQLPSYSSDYISGRRNVYGPDNSQPDQQSIVTSAHPELPFDNNNSDESNSENVPPPPPQFQLKEKSRTTVSRLELDEENENAESPVHLPNPRRTLQHRSPLKNINILDVIVLPSWKKNPQVAQKTQTPPSKRTDHNHRSSPLDENTIVNLENSCPPRQNPHSPPRLSETTILSSQKQGQRQQPRNLFGFEEFIEPDEDVYLNADTTNNNTNSSDITLHEKLKRLKRLRPTDKELPKVPSATNYVQSSHYLKQQNIREMLCSTMIAPRTSTTSIDESSQFFKDCDVELTFKEKQPRRTYVQERPKRKRKQRVQFQLGGSDSEHEDDEQDSLDKSNSPKKRPCTHKEAQRQAQLSNFITSFNKECEEVERFQLIIE